MPTFTQSNSAVIETFDAPHVEGPTRLFDDQTLVVRDPDALNPTFALRLSVERLAQVQGWRIDAAQDSPDTVRLTLLFRQEYRGLGFVDADRTFGGGGEVAVLVDDTSAASVLVDDEGNELTITYAGEGDTIPHTYDQPPAPAVEPPRWLPRSRSCRVRGGFIQVSGQTGAISRINSVAGEL